MTWRVTGIGIHEDRVWAARVQPTNSRANVYTENKIPCVVLATRRQAKPIEAKGIENWQPVPQDKAFEFETTVGEKVMLRIEEEFLNEDEYEATFPNAKNARKHPREEEFPPLGTQRNGPNSKRDRNSAVTTAVRGRTSQAASALLHSVVAAAAATAGIEEVAAVEVEAVATLAAAGEVEAAVVVREAEEEAGIAVSTIMSARGMVVGVCSIRATEGSRCWCICRVCLRGRAHLWASWRFAARRHND